MNNAIEIRFLGAEADVLAAGELRFDPPPAPDLAAQIDAALEIAIGAQVVRAQALSALLDIFLEEFTEIHATIEEMRLQQQRVRFEAIQGDPT